MDSTEYIFCGLDDGDPFAVIAPSLTDWKRNWELVSVIAVPDLQRGQSVVDFEIIAKRKSDRKQFELGFHAQIRWSHGKFAKHPEAKIYIGTRSKPLKWQDVPFFARIVPYSPSSEQEPANPYFRLRKLASGGGGNIYEAKLGSYVEPVAVKELSLHSVDTALLDRLKREIKVLKDLHHPNIVSILDHDLDSSIPWYAMPLAASTLEERIAELHDSPDDGRRIIRQLLDAVGYAHGCGIVHRDLKPSNILLSADGDVQLSDFGIVKCIDASLVSQNLTATNDFLGTYGYAAPEQIRNSQDADTRSDIYALGSIIYEIVTGLPASPSPDLSVLGDYLASVISRCHYEDPSMRYQSIDELRSALFDDIP
jgi:hypothetical protein